ncbi:hypothetical protein MNBD_UNCLBAC01-1529 [hydrothermal vent metagenome]|uniref:Glycosyltransferase 2-like domain-containing protein n=1 Tax=hydrothermal vent metagenome TaxID=652676 RepID=A0A3B1DIW6_9ZZZZ
MDSPYISIVVPAYNCQKTISKTIEAILNQSYASIELIIVDDGSSDATAKVVEQFDVNYLYQNNAGPAAARNQGAKEACGEIILFTDSDCVPQKNWVEKIVSGFKEPEIGVVAGSYGIANPKNILARCIHKEILFRHHYLMPQYPKVFGSYNFGIRKKIFEKVRGFNGAYRYASGEDNDLSYKILKSGYKIYFERNALVDHFHPVCLKKYLQEQYRHGFWRVKMYAEHPAMAKGDNYTFWKDICEVPLSVLIIFLIFISYPLLFAAVCILFILEIFYGVLMMKVFLEAFFFGGVMFVRSFIRTFGFSSGIFFILFKKVIKKDK